MTTEQGGAPSATAGGAPAPTIPPAQVRATAEYLARMVGCYVAEVPPPLPPFKRRPVLGEPKPNMAGNEDGDTWAEGVGWALSWGCQLTFGRDEHTAVPYVQVSLSDEDRHRGITQRSATRAQVAAFARMLTEQFGEPSTVVPDPRDAEIERLRGELHRIRDIALVVLNVLPDDDDRSAVDLVREILVSVGPEKLRRDNQFSNLVAERDRKRRELVDVTGERDRLRQESGSLFRKLCAALDVNPAGETWASFVTRVGALVGERDEAREEWKRADAERYRLRQELDDIRPRVVGIARALGLSASEEGVVKQWISRSVSEPAEPRRWVAGDPEPEPGVTVTTSGWSNGLTWTLRRNGTWHMNNCPTDPEECPTPGTTWGVLLREHGELVEVVSTDG